MGLCLRSGPATAPLEPAQPARGGEQLPRRDLRYAVAPRMQNPLSVAGRALASGDPLAALKLVALREDAPALALRGIAMAQLGDLNRAKQLLRKAMRTFTKAQPLARARCILAQSEVALAARDLTAPTSLSWAIRTLDAHGDARNGAYARLLAIRRFVLLGRVDEAESGLEQLEQRMPAMLATIAELMRAEIALRKLQANSAAAAMRRASSAACVSRIPALAREVEHIARVLDAPAAQLISSGTARALTIAEVEELLQGDALVIDACRRSVRQHDVVVPLASRPVLFALLRSLAEAWPAAAPRALLLREAFGAKRSDDSHRARLRVELGRLRRKLRGLAEIHACEAGFELRPLSAAKAVVLAPPSADHDSALLALLADGESWSTSGLALALGGSQRSVQRALGALEQTGKVRAHGRGRARRWLAASSSEIATALLLPSALPFE